MTKNNRFYTSSNRKAWNQAMHRHRRVMDEKWDKLLAQKDFIIQKGQELEELKKTGFKDKSIAHLCCNNGMELLSLKNNGAGRCVGFDFCDEAIRDAIKRAQNYNLDCEFVISDVLEIPVTFYGSFDLVYITVGALVWVPDMKLLLKNAASLLKKGGIIFIHEHHPVGDIFPYDGETDNLLTAKYPYFNNDIYESSEGIDYYGGTTYDSETTYEFSYTISDLINNLIDNGFMILRFNEYEKDIALGHQGLEKLNRKLPLSYIIIAEKIKS